MRFIGGKTLIIPQILKLIDEKTQNVKVISDFFSGSGAVSHGFKSAGFNTVSSDLMYFSYVLLRGTIQLNEEPTFEKLNVKCPIHYLNRLTIENSPHYDTNDFFVLNNYSPKGGRMYFTEHNSIKIDLMRKTIEDWKKNSLIDDNEYYYLLASLLEAIPFVSNIAGVFGAYLKHWDKRALKELRLKKPNLLLNNTKSKVYNDDANSLVATIETDLSYFDPPYNQRQYLPNYHVLETIAKYDNPIIKGVTGLRNYSEEKSSFCSSSTALSSFEELVRMAKTRYIILSYNTEGLLSDTDITNVLKKYGIAETFYSVQIAYSRYKNAQTKHNKNLKEMLYFIEKEVS